ncbi:MAG: hypothetical protein IJ285_02990 [Clostridia bacterium]|nr:hypothetical protein [Clostridia bacterium]
MSGITELAKLFKERNNDAGYSPMFGKIIELPRTKIRINEKVILNDSHLVCLFNLKEQNYDGDYINLGKEVVLLPFSNNQKFIVVGMVM